MSSLTIGGVSVPLYARLAMEVAVTRHSSGRRSLSIRCRGQLAADLSAVPWTAGVAVAWVDHLGDSGTMTILSAGPQISHDVAAAVSSWSLDGVEASGLAGTVTIAGTAYWGTTQVEPMGGTIQRASNGAGTLLSAWSKRRVLLRGEGAGTGPTQGAGTVAVTTPLYTGNLITLGVRRAWDPDTGLLAWSLEGEEP